MAERAAPRNRNAGKKFVGLWLTQSEFDALTAYCREIGTDKSLFARFAIFSLVKAK